MQDNTNQETDRASQIQSTSQKPKEVKKEVFFNMDHPDYVVGCNFSRDGQYFITGCYDGNIRLWDLAKDGKLSDTINAHEKMQVMTFSKKSKFLATGGLNAVKVYQYKYVRKGPIHTFKDCETDENGHKIPHDVQSLTFSSDNKLIAIGNLNGNIFLYNIETGEKVKDLYFHIHFVNCLTFSPDNLFLYSGSHDGYLSVYNLETFTKDVSKIRQMTQGSYEERGIRCIQSCEHFIALGWGKFIDIFLIHNLQRIAILQGHQREVFCLHFQEGGRLLLSGSWDNTVRIWDMESLQTVQIIEQSHDLGSFSVSRMAKGLKFDKQQPRLIQPSPVDKLDRELKVAVLSHNFNFKDKSTFLFKIKSMSTTSSISVGLCYEDYIKDNSYILNPSNIEHGCYLVQGDGILYSHHDQETNSQSQDDLFEKQRQVKSKEQQLNKKKANSKDQEQETQQQFIYSNNLKFQEGDTIECTVIQSLKQIQFYNKSQPNQIKQLHLNYQILPDQQLQICAVLQNRQDAVEIRHMDCHSSWIKQVSIYPTDKYFATASRDCTAKIWKLIEY